MSECDVCFIGTWCRSLGRKRRKKALIKLWERREATDRKIKQLERALDMQRVRLGDADREIREKNENLAGGVE